MPRATQGIRIMAKTNTVSSTPAPVVQTPAPVANPAIAGHVGTPTVQTSASPVSGKLTTSVKFDHNDGTASTSIKDVPSMFTAMDVLCVYLLNEGAAKQFAVRFPKTESFGYTMANSRTFTGSGFATFCCERTPALKASVDKLLKDAAADKKAVA